MEPSAVAPALVKPALRMTGPEGAAPDAALADVLSQLWHQTCALEAQTRQLAHELDQPLWCDSHALLRQQARELSGLCTVLLDQGASPVGALPLSARPRSWALPVEGLVDLCERNLRLQALLRDILVRHASRCRPGLLLLLKSWLQDADFRTWSLFEASRFARQWG